MIFVLTVPPVDIVAAVLGLFPADPAGLALDKEPPAALDDAVFPVILDKFDVFIRGVTTLFPPKRPLVGLVCPARVAGLLVVVLWLFTANRLVLGLLEMLEVVADPWFPESKPGGVILA